MLHPLTRAARGGFAIIFMFGCSAGGGGDTSRPAPPGGSVDGSPSGGVLPPRAGGSGSGSGSGASALPPASSAAGGGLAAAGGSGSVVTEPGLGNVQLDPNELPPRALALRADGYLDLAPARGEAFDRTQGTILNPPAPAGYTWYPVPGTSCRDGSEAGLFLRFTDSKRLLIFFEGGGACTSTGFCNFNPKNVNQVLAGTGETVLGSALGAVAGRQQPGVYQNNELSGVFSADRIENPFHDWNIAYIPYCTGDVHAGSRRAASVPGVAEAQKFVGFLNTQTFVGRLVPTFAAGLERVVVTGASAGSFGAALNFSMISDAFAGVQTDAILDSGVPFEDQFWPTCLQKSWRELFGLNYGLPPDCEQCFHEDGGGLIGLSDFLIAKHPTAHIALISSMQDEVIRLFFTPGENNCATLATADPVGITLGQLAGAQIFPAATYEAGLLGVRSKYQATGRMASFFLAQANVTLHQHTMRPRFFDAALGTVSMAAFVNNFLNGRMEQVGP